MIIEAIQPFKMKSKTLGALSLEVGERLTWPDKAVEMLLAKFPGKVRLVQDPPFQLGETVQYKVPINIKSPQSYDWAARTGIVQGFDHACGLVKIQPDNQEPMIHVAAVYVQKKTDHI